MALWVPKFKESIIRDLTNKFNKNIVEIISTELEIESEDTQGSPCLLFHRVIIKDDSAVESLEVNIKTLVEYNRTTIYLSSEYANTSKWPGKSKTLENIFDQLKASDKEPGYFTPITLDSLIAT
jgi:hypothetical protein